MNSTMAIAQRELIERRFVLVAATAFLVLALVIPIMPGVHADQRAAALVIGSMGLSSIFTLGLAAILGATVVGRDLSDGRLSFYFSKPVPATSIWWGKVIAAAALLAVCYLIVGFPALMVGAAAAKDAVEILVYVPLVAAALFLLSHVIGTFVRSRSAWFLIDFAALAIFAATIWILTLWLLNGFALELLRRLGEIAAVFASLAILAAGAWQIARGRTDRRRSHKELSRFLWTTLGCGLLILSAYVAWVVSATPGDIAVPDFANQPKGSWAYIGGRARNRMDYHAMFLFNTDSGQFLRLPKMQSWWPALFSDDGKVAVWIVPSKEGSEVHFSKLDAAKPRDLETPFRLTKFVAFNVSADGSRMVTIDRDGILTVDDLRSGKSLGSARIPNAGYWNPVFVQGDLVRIYAYTKGETEIFEYDVNRRTILPTGNAPGFARLNADRSRMLVFRKAGMEVHDARSGALVQSLPGSFYYARFVGDGRVAAITRDQKTLQVFSEGATSSVPLTVAGDSIYEAPGGWITVCGRSGCMVINSTSGSVLRTETGIRPLSHQTTAPVLLSLSKGGLILWNPATGEKRPVI